MEQTWNNDIESVIAYQINKDYDTDEPINFDKIINFLENIDREIWETEINHNFYDLKDDNDDALLMGTRTTLENELKISNIEALNYLMGLPLNFNLESFMDLFYDMDNRFDFTGDEAKQVTRLELNFNKKEKLISQNFESTTHIDVQEFLAWAESKGFIKNKNKPFRVIKKPNILR